MKNSESLKEFKKLNSEKKWSATNTDVEGFIYPL